jgi:uncharacterized protein YjbI with pentapeptide repeats
LANPKHLAKLKEGVKPWGQWRKQNPHIQPDLSKANLREKHLNLALTDANFSKANLSGANLLGTNLNGANFEGADLRRARLGAAQVNWANLREARLGGAHLELAGLFEANLTRANLTRAGLNDADLRQADLQGANLVRADLRGANLRGADLHEANLGRADLSRATLIDTNLEGANLTGCYVYGISAWNLRLEGAAQSNLVITPKDESPIQIDNLEVAQFVYLLLNNEKIRHVIDTITSKVVLILGRFTSERKVVLDALREELRKRDYSPVLFDFEKPVSKDLTGTITTLANMARFIIADLTDPRSVPHELAFIVPTVVVPIQPILLAGQREFGMFADLRKRYQWVLEPYQYQSKELLIAQLVERVIAPAEAKANELAGKKS